MAIRLSRASASRRAHFKLINMGNLKNMKEVSYASHRVTISEEGEYYFPIGDTANGRAALVLHEAPGITGNVRRRCRELTKLGYVAFAPDIHRMGQALTVEQARAAVAKFRSEPGSLRARVQESVTQLCVAADCRSQDVVVFGYCFGGMAALELARGGGEVAALVSFHGLLGTNSPARPGQVKAPVLVCTGALDELVPMQDVLLFQQEMVNAGANWQLIIYGAARHSFTNVDAAVFNDERMKFNAQADRSSWDYAMKFVEYAFDR